MRFIVLALLACSVAGGASAAPDRGRSHGASQPGPTRVATAPAAANTRAAIARQATSHRPGAQAAQRSISVSRAAAQPISRNVRGSYGRVTQTRVSYTSAQPRAHYSSAQTRGYHSSAPSRYGRAQSARYGYAATSGGREAAASCVRGSRAARCSGGERRFAWQSGLPQAAGVQAVACPSGTVETPAIGHTTIMRCMPI
ncbi:MAG: hypothetical protein V4653_03950 [Pseudomonadota bacterium]